MLRKLFSFNGGVKPDPNKGASRRFRSSGRTLSAAS